MSKREIRIWIVLFFILFAASVAYLGLKADQIESELSSIDFSLSGLSAPSTPTGI